MSRTYIKVCKRYYAELQPGLRNRRQTSLIWVDIGTSQIARSSLPEIQEYYSRKTGKYTAVVCLCVSRLMKLDLGTTGQEHQKERSRPVTGKKHSSFDGARSFRTTIYKHVLRGGKIASSIPERYPIPAKRKQCWQHPYNRRAEKSLLLRCGSYSEI